MAWWLLLVLSSRKIRSPEFREENTKRKICTKRDIKDEQMNEHTTARVLLVDDEEDFLQALSERLKIRGLRVKTAPSGKDALRKANQQEFDAVVVDLSMPDMDGIETLTAIKAEHPDVEIIMLTGHGSLKTGVKAIQEGAIDFLEKPVEINKLLEKIGEAKNRRMLVLQQKSQEELKQILHSQSW